MDYTLNGLVRSVDAETVRARVRGVPPDPIRTHWVEIDGRRWPPKQAFRVATGITDEPFISHFALRLFQGLGFTTSPIPGAEVALETAVGAHADVSESLADQAALAFARLDGFLSSGSLTSVIVSLEGQLRGADQEAAANVLETSGLDEDLVDSALLVRQRVGMIDTLIHAAVITRVLPLILEPGERVTKRPSLGAGNDPERNYDLETTNRVAEFKLSSWKGADGGRQRGLFADVVGLSLDHTGRRRQVFVVGDKPTARRGAIRGDPAELPHRRRRLSQGTGNIDLVLVEHGPCVVAMPAGGASHGLGPTPRGARPWCRQPARSSSWEHYVGSHRR